MPQDTNAAFDFRLRNPSEPNLLIVEGRDDELFFAAFIKHLKLRGVELLEMRGKTAWPAKFRAVARLSGFAGVRSVGVVRDANSDPAAAFQSVCGALRDAGLPVPQRPLVPAINGRKVIVMILPGEERPGKLEHLCLKAVAGVPVVPCVDEFFRCLERRGCPLPEDDAKARVQVFVASQPGRARLLGEAAEQGIWPWDAEAFAQVKQFLQELAAAP